MKSFNRSIILFLMSMFILILSGCSSNTQNDKVLMMKFQQENTN